MSNPQWRPDCQGKQDYDGDVVRLSCRLYPRGGGWSRFDPTTGVWQENDDRPHIRPSAIASVLMAGEEILCREEFDGDTESEVKTKVEEWANAMISRVEVALRIEFSIAGKGGGA